MSLERLLKATEVAELLGFSSATVQDWFERGDLPGYRIAGRLRFKESELVEWLEERRVGTTDARGPRVVA